MIVYVDDGAGGSIGGWGFDFCCEDGGGAVGLGEGLEGGRGEQGRVEVECEIVAVLELELIFFGYGGRVDGSSCSDDFFDVGGSVD